MTVDDKIRRNLMDGLTINMDRKHANDRTNWHNYNIVNGKPEHVPMKSIAAEVLTLILSHKLEWFMLSVGEAQNERGLFRLLSQSQIPEITRVSHYKAHNGRVRGAYWTFSDKSHLGYSWNIKTGHNFWTRGG